MKAVANVWADRYREFDDIESIRHLARLQFDVADGLESLPALVAVDRVRLAFQSGFYPTDQSCKIIRTVIQSALSHALTYYSDRREFVARVHREESDIEPYIPILLTGLAGCGKSQIRKAIGRLLCAETSVDLGPLHGTLPLVACKTVMARTRHSLSELLRPLARPEVADGTVKCPIARLPENCAAWLYISGVCLFLVDELQFMTTSGSANTLVAQALLAFSYLRVPFLVVANHSLGHKLKRRPPEERHRLLGHVLVLLPDGPKSRDWIGLLVELQGAAPGAFNFEFREESVGLWQLTAGIKRELVTLLLLAYQLAREQNAQSATWRDVERAYLHPRFATSRADVEALSMHGVGSQALAEDLRCPFPIPAADARDIGDGLKAAREARVAEAARDASMSRSEREAKALVEKLMDPSCMGKTDSRPEPARRDPRPKKSSVQSLTDVGERFLAQLKKGGNRAER